VKRRKPTSQEGEDCHGRDRMCSEKYPRRKKILIRDRRDAKKKGHVRKNPFKKAANMKDAANIRKKERHKQPCVRGGEVL